MSDAQKIKIGFGLILLQIIMLAVTLANKASLDAQAERDGIAVIIRQAGK